MPDFAVPPTSSEVKPRYKRPRTVQRSSKSCAELRCQLSSEDHVTVCSGCVQRGTPCLSSNDTAENIAAPIGTRFDERLRGLENLLEKPMQMEIEDGVPSHTSDAEQSFETPENRNELLTPYSSNGSDVHRNGPVWKAFDNSVAGRSQPLEPERSNGAMSGSDPSRRRTVKLEQIRQSLNELLPSQQDADVIAQSTSCWVLVKILCTAAHDLYRNDVPLSTFNLAAVSKRHPVIIAQTLLYIAICIQQLPPEFDATQLQLYKCPWTADNAAETYLFAVADLVTSDDDLAGSTEGLECLILQGIFYINAGKLRRAWVSIRRALAFAQLLNLQTEFTKPLNENDLMSQMAKRQMWHKVVHTDRYLGVFLGLPCGTGEDCFGDEEESLSGLNTDNCEIFERKICIIAGSVTARNKDAPALTYAPTQEIEERMDRLSMQMSKSWWEIPELDSVDRSLAVSSLFDRLLAQMSFFQLKSLLHLPFFIRAGGESRYEHSRSTCLNASREFAFRYLAFRKAQNIQLKCRVLDFSVFVVTIFLILNQLGPCCSEIYDQQWKARDMSLIEEVISSLEKISSSGTEPVARQGGEVLKKLLAVNTTSRNLRLIIPYLGVISVIRECHSDHLTKAEPPTLSTLNIQQQYGDTFDQDIGVQDLESAQIANYQQRFLVIFESSQSQSTGNNSPMEEWTGGAIDQVFFDSMVNSDIGTERL